MGEGTSGESAAVLLPLPAGFQYAGLHCGVKASGKADLALIYSPRASVAAGVYTQNLVFAAPVEVDRSRTPLSDFRVVVINAGNANACTGKRGLEDALEMTRAAAAACGAAGEQALVMSTGVIGQFLPMERIRKGIERAAGELGDTEEHFLAAARAITTTDRAHKVSGRTLLVDGSEIKLAAMAKGAAMIGPRMATMLAAIMTDAALTASDAQRLLAEAVDHSFNCISVEGHMSTNDTVLLLASGEASAAPLSGEALQQFSVTLRELCVELAKMIPDDGEGSSHLIELHIQGCRDRESARRIAKTVAESALVKTAVTGGDPNWGRIVSAAGYAGVPFDPQGVGLAINGMPIYDRGGPLEFDESALSKSMREHRQTNIRLGFSEGDAEAFFWTSDLTVEYVKFNADYHT